MVVRVSGPGTSIEIARAPVPGAPALRYVPDTRRAEKELGLRSEILLDEGVRRPLAWHRRNAEDCKRSRDVAA
jgi:dTDP-glucose 4,6-dehydratase